MWVKDKRVSNCIGFTLCYTERRARGHASSATRKPRTRGVQGCRDAPCASPRFIPLPPPCALPSHAWLIASRAQCRRMS